MNFCEWISVAPPQRKWKKDVGYLQSFCWESQTHFQNCLFWFSGLRKSQSGEFHTQGQPYFHKLQQKEQNMHQCLEDISGHVPAPPGETPASTNMLACLLRPKLGDYPDKNCLMNLVELAFAGNFLLPFCSHRDHPPLIQALRVPALAPLDLPSSFFHHHWCCLHWGKKDKVPGGFNPHLLPVPTTDLLDCSQQ